MQKKYTAEWRTIERCRTNYGDTKFSKQSAAIKQFRTSVSDKPVCTAHIL